MAANQERKILNKKYTRRDIWNGTGAQMGQIPREMGHEKTLVKENRQEMGQNCFVTWGTYVRKGEIVRI